MSEELKETAVVEAPEAKEEVSMEMVMHDPDAKIMTMKKLLEAGVHYGHQTRRWDPKMSKFIFGARNGIYIIDLVKTISQIEVAYAALKEIVEKGGKVLFVGTNPKFAPVIVEEATRSGSFYITNRWLGGTLTNFRTIQGRIRVLKDLETQEIDGTFERMPKKQLSVVKKEKEKLTRNLEGIKEMRKVPNAVFVIDPVTEHNAVAEARKLNIPVFALCDTNTNPDVVDFAIPGNDDLIKSVRLITSVMADAIVEAKGGIPTVAYTKDEGEDVTMKDVIKQADKENQERLAAIRQARKEKQEKYDRIQAQRAAQRKADGDEEHYQVKSQEKAEEAKEEKAEKPAKKAEAKKEPKAKKPAKAAKPAEEVKEEAPAKEEEAK
jgi:small subunit ribosomal protein S2